MNSDPLFFRCIKADGDLVVGDVYPAWKNADGVLVIATGETDSHECGPDDRAWLKSHFEPATAEDFEASITAAMRSVDEVRKDQVRFVAELTGFNTALLGAGEAPSDSSNALQATSPAGQLRNRAHSMKREATSLATRVKERKEYLESKLGQKMALAMASLADMQKIVKKLEEVVMTVQLYLGRDEQVVCLRDGKPAPAETPLCIRQNVCYMDEECALQESHGIDFEEIGKFDKWLLSKAAHLAQVLPEPKGVVVLQVRRYKKKYESDTLADMLANAGRHVENQKSYWLIRNGERLHRIHAEIFVGERLIPRADELDHFFYERGFGDGFGRKSRLKEPARVRPGSRAYMEAMDQADAVRRHYMRLALVLQGLIDRTQLFAPYKGEARPNLLDPAGSDGAVTFLRDVEGTLTDGRPSFREWLAGINTGLQHGHRIVGAFPTHFGKDDEQRMKPRGVSGVNDGDIHTVIESRGELHFAFRRTDEIYRRDRWDRRGEYGVAKTPGTYRIYRDDKFFICLDGGATVEDMEYYLRDRRQRREYADMVKCLQKGVEVLKKQEKDEKPFRELLLSKLAEAVPGNPCTQEQLDLLVHWYKVKTKEHRSLLADDGKAYRMIVERYKGQASVPSSAEDRAAFMQALARIPDAIYAYHVTGREFGVLRMIDNAPYFLREETWRVTKGTAHFASAVPFVLAQKAHYEAFPRLFTSPTWEARPAGLSASKHLSPTHYPALVEWVKANAWFEKDEDDERLVAIYLRPDPLGTEIRAASIEFNPQSGGWMNRSRSKGRVIDTISQPDGRERIVTWTGAKAPKFGYTYDHSTSTHVDHEGELTKGWEDNEYHAGNVALLIDESVIGAMDKVVAKRRRHNAVAERLRDWIHRTEQSAAQALRKVWEAKQLAKYRSEGGDVEFFEDHLKTLPKAEFEAGWVGEIVTRAVLAGMKPASIGKTPIDKLVADFPRASKKGKDNDDGDPLKVPADQLAQLAKAKWTPPGVTKEDDDD